MHLHAIQHTVLFYLRFCKISFVLHLDMLLSNIVDHFCSTLTHASSLGKRFIHPILHELEDVLTASKMGKSDI